MSGLSHLSGPSPFGGASIAERRGWSSYYGLSQEEEKPVTTKTSKRRSTADEAKERNAKADLRQTAAMFASKDRTFRVACKKVGITPSKRQASKFRRGTGVAFKAVPKLTQDDYDDYDK
jgi:hypothetical protein